jgi:two-component system, NtrC family, response regulator AtoC
MSVGATILIVDDEKNARQGLKQFLLGLNYDVIDAGTGKEAIELVKKERPEIVLTDLKMPEMDGLELLHAIKRVRAETSVILFTAYGTVESAVQAMKAGAYYYLTKPINFDELDLTIKKALHQRHLETENKTLRKELVEAKHEAGDIIGHSAKIKKLIALAKQVAKSNSTVLIQGESGTGKELFAHLIHSESDRANHPFVAVHIAALTETLLASELFGHERGAFTGATERKIGRFERANGGTLFLDEISEIPENMQTKLLRVLQLGEFERVGGAKTLRSDVRLVCATNKNLEEEVLKGKFREDLFYRLNVILLEIPGLRERASDIPLLATLFLEQFNAKSNKTVKEISPEAMQLLTEYDWPGNVRELKNIVERMTVLCRTDTISANEVPQDLRKGKRLAAQKDGPGPSAGAKTIYSMEEQMIRRALSEAGDNKSIAAKRLGISRRTLYRRMREYKLGEPA